MVVQIITKVLNVADCRFRNYGVDEVPREQNKGNVANILSLSQVWEMAKFERGVASCVEYLWCTLNRWEAPSVNEFLKGISSCITG